MQFQHTYAPLSLDQIRETGLAPYIDHTLLKPEATEADIEKICKEALQFNFAGVCVHSRHISLISGLLKGSKVLPVSVVGFPHGANDPRAVAFESLTAVKSGAREVDMVIPIGMLKAGNNGAVKETIQAVVSGATGAVVKVIIETGLLSDEEKKRACALSAEAGAHFVKTCTGFATGAAEEADIRLMKSVVGNSMGVKASGGIRSIEKAVALLAAGAHRLGTSSGVALMQNTKISGGY